MRRALPMLLFAALAAAPALAALGPAALSGTVRSSDGLLLPHVVVALEGSGVLRRATSGPDGRYRIAGLAEGRYTLRAEAPGFVLASDPRVEVAGEARADVLLEPAPVREQLVVAATRGDALASGIGVAVAVLDGERVGEREPSSFLDLLRELPGVSVARAGALGHQASAFVRGGESNFARVLVDGVAVNEPGGAYNLAAQFPLELGRVELVRGAASSLYGSDALAGVLHLVTRRPAPGERPRLTLEAEGGGFAWRRARASTAGSRSRLDWNLGLARLETDGQHANSAFTQTAGAAALGVRLGERTSLRAFARGETSRAGTPGPLAFGRPDLDASSDHDERVLSAELRHAGPGSSHVLRGGLAKTGQLSRNPLDSGDYLPRAQGRVAAFPSSDFPNPEGFLSDSTRFSLGYQVEAQPAGAHLLSAGAELEREGGELGDRRGPLLSPVRLNAGAYLQDRWAVGGRLFLTLGGRVERNASYGTRAVPRAAAAWRLGAAGAPMTLRASAGAGIKEPSFLQSFGVSEFALGNPELRPERSRSYDLGAEQRLFRDRLRLEATAFHHDYRDQIAYKILSFSPFRGSYENLGRTRARGLELALDAAPRAGLRVHAQYTLLEGEVLTSVSASPLYAVGRPLLRRPRHQGSLSAAWSGGRASAGATLVLVGRRADSDFLGLGLEENPGHARLDARLRARLASRLEAYAVAENLLDREYQEVLGFPAPGRALRVGLRLRSAEAARP